MPRRPRLQFPGAVYHVMSRGNRKSAIFETEDDRHRLLATLEEVIARYGVGCLAFCLMGNHYHLVLDTPRANLSEAMRHLNALYTQRSNRSHRRTGHVFEGRFRSLVVQYDAYLRQVARYVVLNPVRAGLVRTASAWPWSSYSATAGLTDPISWLDTTWIGWAFDAGSRIEAQERYRLYVNDSLAGTSNLNLRAPALGDPTFEAAVRGAARTRQAKCELPRAVMALSRPSLPSLFAGAINQTPERDRLIEVAHVVHGYRLAEIAWVVGLDPSTVSHIFLRQRTQRAATAPEGEQDP